MKKLLFFLLIPFVLLSCNEAELEKLSTKNDIEVLSTKNDIGIWPMVSPLLGVESKTNPNLYDQWEKVDTIYLNGSNTYAFAPWTTKSGDQINIPDNIRKDIRKEDGWMMLGHTMEDQLSEVANVMLFYHKRSGILKGFYHSKGGGNNQNFKWVLGADSLSSIIPANSKEYNLTKDLEQYAITSNLLATSVTSSTGALRNGWNCFTFELPYGEINNSNAIVNIDGYNVQSSSLEATGSFSGQVIVPSVSTSNSLDSWKSYFNTVSSLTGSIDKFGNLFNKKDTASSKASYTYTETRIAPLAILGIISSATSVISSIIGGASHFTSKNENIVNRYNLGGTIKLNGSIIQELAGAVKIISKIEINKLNNNQPLGVWGLKEYPKITINRYFPGYRTPEGEGIGGKTKFHAYADLAPQITKESVIINPALKSQIKNYKVSTSYIHCTKSEASQLEQVTYEELGDQNKWYVAEIPKGRLTFSKMVHLRPTTSEDPNPVENVFLLYMTTFPETYMNVIVDIEYNDGEFFSTSKLFKIEGKVYDNKKELENIPGVVFG